MMTHEDYMDFKEREEMVDHIFDDTQDMEVSRKELIRATLSYVWHHLHKGNGSKKPVEIIDDVRREVEERRNHGTR